MTTPARDLVAAAFSDALGRAARQHGWQGWESEPIDVEVPANVEHGDYATSVPMRLARTLRKPPRDIANAIKDQLDLRPPLAAAEVAGGGFVNVRLDDAWLRQQAVDTVVIAGYMTHMCCDTTARQAVHRGFTVEFLSDATGTLPLKNTAGEVSAEELQRAILCAQQMLLSEVISTDAWCRRIAH